MKNWIKALLIIISLVITIIIGIIGINQIQTSYAGSNRIAFYTLYCYFEGYEEIGLYGIALSSFRPYYTSFIIGIALFVISIVCTCIIIGKTYADISYELGDQQKKILRIILIISIIICFILIISGGATLLNKENEIFAIVFFAAMIVIFDMKSFIKIAIYYGVLKPNSSSDIIAIVMIIIGLVGVIFQIIICFSEMSSEMLDFKYTVPVTTTFKPAGVYNIRTRKKITIKKCPACKAPLKKTPPCECDYCGTVLEF
ncbi:MAG: hypothetical protein ACFFCM_08680 [Promethearchaeota archaeon]